MKRNIALVWLVCAAVYVTRVTAQQPMVPEQVVLEGDAEVVVEDHAANAVTRYFVNEAGRRHEFRLDRGAAAIHTGDRVRVRGRRLPDGTLALTDGSGTQVEVINRVVDPSAVGQQKALVILVNFTSNATQPYTVSQAQAVMNAVNTHYWQSSYSQATITGASGATADVSGWHTINYNTAVCDTTAIANAADAAAIAAGYTLSNYTRRIYEFPTLAACGWQGLAVVSGGQAWINGIFTLQSVGHELGHNLGLYHANAYDCGAVALGPSCTVLQYTNRVDIMGNSNTGDFDLFTKEWLGWIGYGASPPLTTVETSGTYVIGPYEAVNGASKGLKILKSGSVAGQRTFYYLEYRQPLANDAFLSAFSNIKAGVVIGTGSEATANSNLQLDMTPATTSWNDPALTVGNTFVDPDTGLTIQTVSVDANGATVTVTLPNYLPTASVSLNTINPGTNDTLTANVTTTDPNGNPVSLNYVWKASGVVKKTATTSSLADTFDLSVAGHGDAGEVITVEVTPSDGTLTGNTVSATAIVQSSPHNISFAASGAGAATITVSYNGIAGNGLPTSGSSLISSPGPGVTIPTTPGTSFAYQFPATVVSGTNSYRLQGATPSSGFTTGAAGGSTTITGTYTANAAPTATVSLNTPAPGTNATLTATAARADADGDTVRLTYVWRVNGVAKKTTVASSSLTDTLDLSAAGNGDVGQTVVVEVTPNDGVVNGVSVSAAAVVQNTAPVLAAIGSRVVGENALLSFALSASDVDAGPLTYTVNNLPPGATFDAATRVFTWTPAFTQAGSYDVTFTVSDGTYGASELASITVTNTNRAPVLDPIGAKSIAPAALLAFTISATDADGDIVTYAATSLPAGATFDAVTRTFSWMPGTDQVGKFLVTFVASDGSATDGEVVQITVSKPKGRR